MLKRRETSSKIDKTIRFMRCFEETINSLIKTEPIPLSLCYQRSKVYFKIEAAPANQDSNIYLFDSPCPDLDTYYNYLNNFEYLNSDHVLDRNVIEYLVSNNCTRINNIGRWILVTKIKIDDDNLRTSVHLNPPLWLLKYRYEEGDQPLKLVEILDRSYVNEKCRFNKEWVHFIDANYSLVPEENLIEKFKPNIELMRSISVTPKEWSMDNDEELADLLKDIVNTDIPGIFCVE